MKRYPVFVVKRINHFKCPYYSEFYRLNAMLITISVIFLIEIKEITQNFFTEPQHAPNIQSSLQKEEQNGSITLPNFKLYYKILVINPNISFYVGCFTPSETTRNCFLLPTASRYFLVRAASSSLVIIVSWKQLNIQC